MQTIINYLKKNGFVYPSSQIYDNLKHVFDYGPLGVNLKNNLKKQWRKCFLQDEPFNFELDSAIFASNKVYEASGHLQNFFDVFVNCKDCAKRTRIDEFENASSDEVKITDLINKKEIICPFCKSKNLTSPRSFNLMFKINTNLIDAGNKHLYLRPETAQGIFVNFKNITQSLRLKIPFGIGQFGKAFRNEITPRYFIYKTREFEQAELEFFCHPKQWEKYFDYYLQKCHLFLIKNMQLKDKNLTEIIHAKDKLAHYSLKTIDFNYNFPFGSLELFGISCRSDYDLKQHSKFSKTNLDFLDQKTNEKYFPYVVEPSFGLDRLFLALICEHLTNETLANGDNRVLLKIPYHLAPFKLAVLPLSNKLAPLALEIFRSIKSACDFEVVYDTTQSIGKRYRRQDEIGTPFCLTVDFDSESDQSVTLRNRDNMKQERININKLIKHLNFLKF